MAKMVLKDAYFSLGGTDMSAHVASVTINYEAETQEATAMGDDTRGNLAGLKNWTIEAELYNNYADNSIDELLFGLVGADDSAVAVRPVNTTISTGNPEYQGAGIVTGYTPVNGAVGDVAKTKVTIVPYIGSDLARDVTP